MNWSINKYNVSHSCRVSEQHSFLTCSDFRVRSSSKTYNGVGKRENNVRKVWKKGRANVENRIFQRRSHAELRILMAGESRWWQTCHHSMVYIKAFVCIYMQVGDICLFVFVFVFNQRQARRQNNNKKKNEMDKRFNNKSQKLSLAEANVKCVDKSNQIK